MENNQVKLLLELAEELKTRKKNQSKEDAIKTLVSAKILTKSGKFTKHYSELEKVFVSK